MNNDYLKNYSDLHLLLRMKYPTDKENVFVDVGAFRGGFSSAFAKRGWRVIAFEPEPGNFKLLTERVNKNPNITCVQKAVTDISGKQVPFFVDRNYPARNSLQPVSSDHQPSINIDTIRLDDNLSELNIREVTVLKIDAEGADFHALKGFDFTNIKPVLIMIEFNDQRTREHFGYDHHDIISFMKPYKYDVFILETGNRKRFEFNYQVGSTQYKLKGIEEYPYKPDPKMGNIVFIQRTQTQTFEHVYQSYLDDLDKYKIIRIPIQLIRKTFVNIPYAKRLYYLLRRIIS